MIFGGKIHVSLTVKKSPACYNLFASSSIYRVLLTSALTSLKTTY